MHDYLKKLRWQIKNVFEQKETIVDVNSASNLSEAVL